MARGHSPQLSFPSSTASRPRLQRTCSYIHARPAPPRSPINPCSRPNSVYIDFGAWVGPTALFASSYAKHTYAMEPGACRTHDAAGGMACVCAACEGGRVARAGSVRAQPTLCLTCPSPFPV